ncbi:MAG: restriction endonuclease [Betaproteobacteria bacterium]|nr:restriction endonuclease [Betaproteobacteria bacterium]
MSKRDAKPSFKTDLQGKLVSETLKEIRSGRIDDRGFEELIQKVLLGLGANEAKIIPRNKDKGADIVATFTVAGAFKLIVAVQAKHWRPEPPVGKDVVEQLIKGIEAEWSIRRSVIRFCCEKDSKTCLQRSAQAQNEPAPAWRPRHSPPPAHSQPRPARSG